MNPRVFISYAREDSPVASKLYKDLKKNGINPWIDNVDLLPGQNWKHMIKQAISKSEYFIFLLSKSSVKKKGFIQNEQKIALEMLNSIPDSDVFMIPVRLEECEIPEQIKDIHATDIYPSYELGLNRILSVLTDRYNTINNKDTVDFAKDSDSIIKNYLKNILRNYNTIKIFGMSKPVLLSSLYVRVNILKKISYKECISKDSLEKQYEKNNSFGFINIVDTFPGQDLFDKEKYIFDYNAFEKLKLEDIPENILTSLKNIENHTFIGEDCFIEQINEILKIDDSTKYLQKIVKHSKQDQKYILLGKPGAGKTTFLKYLSIHSINNQEKKATKIPIFINLKEFSETKLQLLEFIANQFEHENQYTMQTIISLLNSGKCLLLLDGLDEVNENAIDFLVEQVKSFTKIYYKNQYLLSCRIASYNHWFESFVDVEISDFNEDQIISFVHNWFGDEEDVAESCLKKLEQNKRIKELCSTPLLLTLLCITFDELLDFPQNRAELYKEAIDALLKKWDSTRRIKRDTIYEKLSIKRKESLLGIIAEKSFKKNEYFIPKRKLEKYIFDLGVALLRPPDDIVCSSS